MHIELELELADNDAPIIPNYNSACSADTTSTSWKIHNCQTKCDILSLDNSLNNSCENHLFGGNILKTVYGTYISSLQTTTSADTQVNVSRSLAALRSVFMSLKTFTEARVKWFNKSWNSFYSTIIGNRNGPSNINDSNAEIQHLQLMIGGKMYPEHPIRSHAECFYNLRKSLGVQANSLHALDIKGNEYHNHKFLVGFDTKKNAGVGIYRNSYNKLFNDYQI